MKMGLREANQRFSKAVRTVKAGEEVVLTERGRPVAVLKPFRGAAGGDVLVRRLQAAGLLRLATEGGPLTPWRPRKIKGAPLSQTVRAERDAS